jgi:hypothetical protein
MANQPQRRRYYKAKTPGKWGEVFLELQRLDQRRFRRGVKRIRPLLTPETAQNRITRLVYVLNEFAQESPRAYSFLLQSWLSMLGISWPKGVFKYDYSVSERGRQPRTDSGIRASKLRALKRLPSATIAQKLLPEQYKQNRKEAIKCVRDAALAVKQLSTESLYLLSVSKAFFLSSSQERVDFSTVNQVWDGDKRKTAPVFLRNIAKDLNRANLIR